jgi:hypothetical protein
MSPWGELPMTANAPGQIRKVVAALLVLPSIFLVCYAASVSEDRIPGSFIAEESTYYLMTRSIWEEGDLLWTWEDSRYAAGHHRGELANVVLMTPDRGTRVYYAKPYLYSFFAVPFYALLGTNGFLVFNALMFVLMILLGVRYLGSCNPPVRSVLLGGTFFLLSATVPYIFWIQPEVLNMLTLFLGCYFWLFPGPGMAGAARGTESEERAAPSPVGLRDPVVRVGLAGFFFALSAFSKLPHLAFGGVLILHCLLTRRWGRVVSSVLAFLLTLTVLHMGQLALSETASVYHSTRKNFSGLSTFPHNVPSAVAWKKADEGGMSRYGGGGMGLARLDGRAAYNIKYLFFGRHTGLFPYFFPGLAALALYFIRLRSRRMTGRGYLILALFGVLLFYILWFPANYQGGPDFIGNRHVASIYPALLFLVGSVTGISVHLVSWLIAGLFLAQVLTAPFGAADPRMALQAHVQSPLFRLLPYETTLRYVPGYTDITYGMKFTPKRYRVRLPGGGRFVLEGTRFLLVGEETAELLVVSRHPLARLLFLSDSPLVEGWCRGAEGRVSMAGLLRFSPDPLQAPVTEEEMRLVLEDPRPAAVHTDWLDGEKRFFYRVAFRRHPGSGRAPRAAIRLSFLGEGEPWLRESYFRAVLEHAGVPPVMTAGGKFTLPVRILSRSPFAWDSSVRLSYHWRRNRFDSSVPGPVSIWDGLQTMLPGGALGPGETSETSMQVQAPEETGDYILELDLVADQVAWFAGKSPGREPLGRYAVRVIRPAEGEWPVESGSPLDQGR